MITKYERTILPEIREALFKGKIIIIYGARQVGKTTLIQQLRQEYGADALYLNCDEPDIRHILSDQTSTAMRRWIGRHTLVLIDEAQRVRNIGLSLKLLVDTYPEIQIVATGSSSFALSNQVIEPLTGRKIEFQLYPLSVQEVLMQNGPIEFNRLLEHHMIYGMYPGVITSDEPERLIREIASSYLYRDILEYQIVKNTEQLHRLLQALALQIGNEVSYNELSSLLGISKNTVERYVNLLEQGYIIFRLPPFSRNLRKELSKRRKIYFYDLGIRNALINNFNSLHLRQDTGQLWENFCIVERKKLNRNQLRHTNDYFWRTYQGEEIDYIEEAGGQLLGFEFKWRAKRWRKPKTFMETYTNSELHMINRENFLDFLT